MPRLSAQHPARALTRSAEAHSPPPAAPTFRPCRPNAEPVERGGDLPKRLCPGGLGLPNGGRDAIGECVGAGRVVRVVGHQAGNEMDVSAPPIKLGNRDGAFTVPARLGESGGELRAALDRVRAFAGLDLDEFADDLVTLGGGETGDGRALGVDRRLTRGKMSGECVRAIGKSSATFQHSKFGRCSELVWAVPTGCQDVRSLFRNCVIRPTGV
jgi:hypothetical protein